MSAGYAAATNDRFEVKRRRLAARQQAIVGAPQLASRKYGYGTGDGPLWADRGRGWLLTLRGDCHTGQEQAIFGGIRYDSGFPKSLIFLHAVFERAPLLTSKTRERDNASATCLR
jgi:hypothetical protein